MNNQVRTFFFLSAMMASHLSLAFTVSNVQRQHPSFATRAPRHNSNAMVVLNQSPTEVESGASTKQLAPVVSGEELEVLLAQLDEQPLVVDAYATWCGPCLLMAPEFEAAAKELEGRVRFVKLDTDRDEEMAARLNIMGLPTLLFLDQYTPEDGEGGEGGGPQAVLKERIEGALRKESIVEVCEFLFFDGPRPEQIS